MLHIFLHSITLALYNQVFNMILKYDDLVSVYHLYTNIHYLRSRSYYIVENIFDRLICIKYVDENTVYM